MIFEWTFLSCQCQQSCGDFQISEGRKRVFKILIIPKHRLFTTHSECIMPICTDLWALCTVLRKKATFCTEWTALFLRLGNAATSSRSTDGLYSPPSWCSLYRSVRSVFLLNNAGKSTISHTKKVLGSRMHVKTYHLIVIFR